MRSFFQIFIFKFDFCYYFIEKKFVDIMYCPVLYVQNNGKKQKSRFSSTQKLNFYKLLILFDLASKISKFAKYEN